MRLSIAQIHTHQHRSPILTFRSAGAGVDFQDRIHRIFFAAEHISEFECFDGIDRLLVIGIYFLFRDQLILIELKGRLEFTDQKANIVVVSHPFFNSFHLFHLLFSALRVIPEVRRLRAELFFFKLNPFSVDVQVFM